jgi:transposase-like protein
MSAFAGFRFPAEVIVVAVRWYLRYNLSYRDVEELLVERGVKVDHVSVFRWVQRFTPLIAEAARFGRHAPGDRWFVDETYVKVSGTWRYVYRAIDQHGQVIDALVWARRDADPARRFFQRALGMLKVTPGEVVTDAAAIYPAVLDELLPVPGLVTRRYQDRVREQPQRAVPGMGHGRRRRQPTPTHQRHRGQGPGTRLEPRRHQDRLPCRRRRLHDERRRHRPDPAHHRRPCLRSGLVARRSTDRVRHRTGTSTS